jgi:hypothetical protein
LPPGAVALPAAERLEVELLAVAMVDASGFSCSVAYRITGPMFRPRFAATVRMVSE